LHSNLDSGLEITELLEQAHAWILHLTQLPLVLMIQSLMLSFDQSLLPGMSRDLREVLLELAKDSDHLTGNELVLTVRLTDLTLQVIVTGFLILLERLDVLGESLIKFAGLCL
jgi:hypothetical protein